MASYPGLSRAQQKKLPELMRASGLPALFSDSTHQLWDCETLQGPLIVKICNNDTLSKSVFWQGMHQLFAVDLPKQLGEFSQVYQSLTTLSPLEIPGYIASASVAADEQAFIAIRKISGEMLLENAVETAMVATLARHIANLHLRTELTWGSFIQPDFSPMQWPQRLQNTLFLLASNCNIPADILQEATEMAGCCTPKSFVPLMPDLRWDQFLQHKGKLSALVDLDAFVFAPRELDFILLEYLLDEQQARVFANQYQKVHRLPNLNPVRKPYRLLLFLMNVLGEKDPAQWMQAANRF